MTCELITGSAGVEHISSADAGSMYASVFGGGRYAVKQGNNLSATLASANSVEIGTGAGFMDGRYWRVTATEAVGIDSGAQGLNRIDLIGVKYVYASGTGIETCSLAVVKGTPTSGDPVEPTYTDGDINTGASEAFFPLYSVTITGVTPADPVKLFKTMTNTISCPWPVGAVLQMTNGNDPNDAYPGTTWALIQGKFLLGASSGHTLGTTGGAESVTLTSANMPAHTHTYDKANSNTNSHTLTVNQIPSHSHGLYYLNRGVDSGSTWVIGASTNKDGTSNAAITNTGGGQGHSHGINTTSANSGSAGSGSAVSTMPPFKVVNMWERTA